MLVGQPYKTEWNQRKYHETDLGSQISNIDAVAACINKQNFRVYYDSLNFQRNQISAIIEVENVNLLFLIIHSCNFREHLVNWKQTSYIIIFAILFA